MILLSIVASAFIFAPLVGWADRGSSHFMAVIPLALFFALSALLPGVAAGEVLLEVSRWIPSLGISASFRLDGLSLTFGLLITGIGAVVFLYAATYLKGAAQLPRFFTVLTLFMASMLGAVLADDIVLLVVFWELTSLTSFLLVGFTPERAENRRAAQQGFLVTVAGGLAMLAGAILLGSAAGSYSISAILERGEIIATHPTTPIIIILIAAGAFAKSAQVPLHSWLANAMVAPTPVSAYLHSATMVKLGIYLLARLDPIFSDHALWIALLSGFGVATMLVGATLALRETDLKRVLAYSTIVSLGTLVMLIGLPGQLAAVAAVTFLIVHALYKACLFLVAGIIDYETGTRDSSALGGLRYTMPITAAAALLGALSMAGLPPFFGFVAKELVYEVGLTNASSWLLVIAALLANVSMIVVAGIIAVRCFAGSPVATPKAPHDPPWPMLAGPVLLAVLGLLLGLFPWIIASSLIVPAASSIAGEPVEYALSLWHGFTPMLALSVLTVALGILLFRNWDSLRTRLKACTVFDRWGPDAQYDRLMYGLQSIARWQTGIIQQGSLRIYVGRTFLVLTIAALTTIFLREGMDFPSFGNVLVPESTLAILLVVATLAVVQARNFTAGIVAAGMVGFTVALIFLFRGAPDLAFTQFSVEALAVVIFLAIAGRMPFREPDFRGRSDRLRDAAIAGALGITATLVLLAVLAQPFDARLSDFFRETSVPGAHGRNIVNVIIVDFRALDTLGEIAVLGLAALSTAAIVAGLRMRNAEKSR